MQYISHSNFKFILTKTLSICLRPLEVLLFSEFINEVFILCYIYTKFIILLYTFLVISFA